MITISDNRPKEDERPPLNPSTIKKTTLPKGKKERDVKKWNVEKLANANEFKEGEEVVVVGIKDKHLNGKTAKIVTYEPNLNRWEVELGETTMYLSPDYLQSKYIKASDDGP